MQKLSKLLKGFMDIIGMLKEFFGMTRAVSEEARQRDAEKNTPAMQQGAVNVHEQKIEDEITNHAAKGNLDEIRKDDAA